MKISQEKIGTLNKILVIVFIVIFAFFILTNIIGFSSGKAKFAKNLRPAENIPQEQEQKEYVPFAGLGRIRTSTLASKEGGARIPLVISVWFNYKKDDTQFYEELSSKSAQIKSLISAYFSKNTKEYFLNLGEENVKKQLLSIINEHLVLGKIENLYFSEYIFLN